ncbi:MAG: DUF5723 family protein [Flavobacteriales bacterium]
MKNLLVILPILTTCFALHGQDNLGIAGSSRAPANTVLANPSSIVDSRAFIDINLAGAGIFARNNFVYLDGKQFSFRTIAQTEMPLFKRQNAPYNVYADVILHGPSATFAVKQHAFGIYSAARVVADVRGVTEEMSYYITESFQYREQMGVQQHVQNLRANGLAWGELGLTYGTILASDGNALIQGGITAKRLLGVAGVGLRLDDWTYVVRDSSNMETQVFQGEYGFNDPTQNASYINGKGWGFDIGFTYKMRKSNSQGYKPHDPCTDGDYLFKIGASLLDFGRISFTGPFYRNVFNQNESSEWNNYQGTSADEVSDLDSLFNNNFNLVEQNSGDGRFRMKLPTALSVQADYNLGHNFYLYGALTYGLPRMNSLGVQRASYLGVAPRWEIKRFEVSLPVSIYEWRHPQVGLMLRLNSIIIGSDNLGWFLFNQDIYGADIYINIKYTIFKHWKCKTKKGKKKPAIKRGDHDPLPCPAW